MPLSLIEHRLTLAEQPQGEFELSDLARQFRLLYMPGIWGRRSLTDGTSLSADGSDRVALPRGWATPYTSNSVNVSTPAALSAAYPLVLAWSGQFINGSNTWVPIDVPGLGGGSGDENAFRLESGTLVGARVRNGFGSVATPQVTVPGGTSIGVDLIVVLQSLSASDHRLYVNGVQANSTTSVGAISSAKTTGFLQRGALALANHRTYWAAFGNRALPDSVALDLTSSGPGQWARLFEPQRIWVPVTVAGGGSSNLTLADASHAHAADSLTLTTSTALSIADAAHAHAADNITLTTTGSTTLALADALHAHGADAPTLTTASVLAVAEALHAHAADNVVLGVAGVANLAVADATHGHTVDGLTLSAASVLAVQEALHAHAADALTLSGAPVLQLADALHAHTADGLTLQVSAWLVVADARHLHSADNAVLVLPGGGAGATAAEIVAALMDEVIEPGVTFRAAVRLVLAALTGRTVGLGTGTEQYLSADGSKPRITATFDGDDNRTSVTLDGS